jgi:hypothetical protein
MEQGATTISASLHSTSYDVSLQLQSTPQQFCHIFQSNMRTCRRRGSGRTHLAMRCSPMMPHQQLQRWAHPQRWTFTRCSRCSEMLTPQ